MEAQQRRVGRARVATRAAATATVDEPTTQVASAEAQDGAGDASDESAVRADSVSRVGYAPVVRVDAARREVELCATSEAIDSYGTVFDYAASKDAFMRWIGNVREMHERRAVGQRVQVRCDDAARRIVVRVRISRGAPDTWEKLLDGTLRGASIGASNVTWEQQARRVGGRERTLDVATRYDLVELSLVDNPSNPDALGVTIVRNALPDIAMLDHLDAAAEERSATLGASDTAMQTASPLVASARDALGASDASGAGGLHGALHEAVLALLRGCGCPLCQAASAALGVVAGQATTAADDGGAAAQRWGGPLAAAGEAALARALAGGLGASVARLENVDAAMRGRDATLQRALGQFAGTLEEVRQRVERIEAQPLPGGPMARALPGGATSGERAQGHAIEKGDALAPQGRGASWGTVSVAEQYRALESLAGKLRDPQAQIAVAAEMIRLQREG